MANLVLPPESTAVTVIGMLVCAPDSRNQSVGKKKD